MATAPEGSEAAGFNRRDQRDSAVSTTARTIETRSFPLLVTQFLPRRGFLRKFPRPNRVRTKSTQTLAASSTGE